MRININDPDVDFEAGYTLTYRGRPFTGEVIETTKNGQVIALTDYRDGYADGISLEWYPGGVLRAEGTVRSGIAIGTHRDGYADGRPAEEKEFDDRGNQLSVRSWDENGILIEDKNFR